MMNFQALAWMTRVVAQGNTMMALAIFLPLNLLFSSSARMKPSSVDSPTTTTVHTSVLLSTTLKALLPSTLEKLATPLKPFTRPALVTLLKAM